MLDLSIPLVCLALNIYHESRADPLIGQLAVGLVTLNRAHHRKDKICEVVFADRQFSWTLLPDWAPRDQKAWQRSIKTAKTTLKIEDFTRGSTYFHASYMRPKSWNWSKLEFVGQFGNHLFYKASNGKTIPIRNFVKKIPHQVVGTIRP